MSKEITASQVSRRRFCLWSGLFAAGILLTAWQPGEAAEKKEKENMSKAMFVSQVELNPGMSGEELEKFWVEEFLPNASELPGWTPTLHKGDQGRRTGQYLMVNYFNSVERARQLFPGTKDAAGQPEISDEFNQWAAANPVWGKAMSYFDYGKMMEEYTEYTEIR